MWERALEILSPYKAIVFDLDGTLVRLRVDWRVAQREMADLARSRAGVDYEGMTVWSMLRASQGDLRKALEAILQKREVEGAKMAERLPLADLLLHIRDRRVGVVSLNSRRSCEVALERTGLTDLVDALVAREDAERLKPDPEPLLKCIRILGSSPQESVFIGDRERDRMTAVRAGTVFLSPVDLEA